MLKSCVLLARDLHPAVRAPVLEDRLALELRPEWDTDLHDECATSVSLIFWAESKGLPSLVELTYLDRDRTSPNYLVPSILTHIDASGWSVASLLDLK